MRWIYLSPHLDDAVLSCGGLIFQQRRAGTPVEIWNWMSGIPADEMPLSDLARSVHAGWELASAKETLDARLTEDRLAALRVNANPRYFDFLDCIYRCADDGEILYPGEIFVSPHPADHSLVSKIAEVIAKNLRPDDVLVCPLTIGKHPDHVIVRRAAEQAGQPLRYYVDIPYAFWYPEQLAEITENLEAEAFPISEGELVVWQEAVAAYSSQLTVLFGGEEMMKNALKLHWRVNRDFYLYF
ncbi:MAG: hypothetical protein HN975_02355 [Anaerolineae bacterium]|jgi:LmbE family N-acetylglucosaminyl deacetylase|nr:hypothetical protein [Anaerolineae bacterium]